MLAKGEEIEMPCAKFSKVFIAVISLFALMSAPAFALPHVSIAPNGLSACACDPVYYDVSVYSDQDDVFEMQFDSAQQFSAFIQQPQLPVPRDSAIKTTLVQYSVRREARQLSLHCYGPRLARCSHCRGIGGSARVQEPRDFHSRPAKRMPGQLAKHLDFPAQHRIGERARAACFRKPAPCVLLACV